MRVLEQESGGHFYTGEGRVVREGVAEEAWRCYDSLQETMLGRGGH